MFFNWHTRLGIFTFDVGESQQPEEDARQALAAWSSNRTLLRGEEGRLTLQVKTRPYTTSITEQAPAGAKLVMLPTLRPLIELDSSDGPIVGRAAKPWTKQMSFQKAIDWRSPFVADKGK